MPPKVPKSGKAIAAAAKAAEAKIKSSKRLPSERKSPVAHDIAGGIHNAEYGIDPVSHVARTGSETKTTPRDRLIAGLRGQGINLYSDELGDTTMFSQDVGKTKALRDEAERLGRTDVTDWLDQLEETSGKAFDEEAFNQIVKDVLAGGKDKTYDSLFYRLLAPRDENLESDPNLVDIVNITPNKLGRSRSKIDEINRIGQILGIGAPFNVSSYFIAPKGTVATPFDRDYIRRIGRDILLSDLRFKGTGNRDWNNPLGDYTLAQIWRALKNGTFSRDTILGEGTLFDSLLRARPNEGSLRERYDADTEALKSRAAVLEELLALNPALAAHIKPSRSVGGGEDVAVDFGAEIDDFDVPSGPLTLKSGKASLEPSIEDVFVPSPIKARRRLIKGDDKEAATALNEGYFLIDPLSPTEILHPEQFNKFFRGGNVSVGGDKFYLSQKGSPKEDFRINGDIAAPLPSDIAALEEFPSLDSLTFGKSWGDAEKQLAIDFYNDLARKTLSRNAAKSELDVYKGGNRKKTFTFDNEIPDNY